MTPLAAMTREQVRSIDHRAVSDYHLSGLVLMENAGRGVCDLLLQRGAVGPVVICCGKGNNGGDGFVIARHLEAADVDVQVLLLADPAELSGDAAANFRILEAARTPIRRIAEMDGPELEDVLRSADWIVDALLGTGPTSEIRGPYRAMIARINAAGQRVLAVDLPSGMECDTGQPLGECVQALVTATFVARKVGFDGDAATSYTGEVVVLPIGVPQQLLRA